MKKSPNEIKELILDNLLESNITYNENNDDQKSILYQEINDDITNTNDLTYINSFGNDYDDSIYIFNKGNKTILAASDDDLNPIIGTFAGEYDENNMPENFKEMMQHYAKEIEDYQSGNIEFEPVESSSKESYKASWKTVPPLLPYTFAQKSPYNFKLVDISTNNEVGVVTGCNNTAMAQIIAYWGNIGINGIKYRVGCKATTAHTSGQKYDCPALPAISEFDYDNILEHYNSYYNENGVRVKPSITPNTAQKNAVSQLMKYIGFTCLSTYGSSGTGTSPVDTLQYASNFYFNTSRGYIDSRTDSKKLIPTVTTNESFETAVYNELINKRPIFFFAYKPKWDSANQTYVSNGGHAFNCDGYDAETDKYHFNWGWEGQYNGWFSMTALNPAYPNNPHPTLGYNYDKFILGNFYPQKFISDITKGDYNGDGQINIYDVLFLTNLVDTDNVIPIYDRNGDGYVDLKDVSDIVDKLDIKVNKTYELAINNKPIFDSSYKNVNNYIHNKININKLNNKVEYITETKTNDNVTYDSLVLDLPVIANLTENILTAINRKSISIKNKFNEFISNKGNNNEKNLFVYLKKNKSKFIATPEYVNSINLIDLGLPSGTKWANMNIGANNPTDIGNYYAWGETEIKDEYTNTNYKYYTNGNKPISIGASIAKNNNYDVAYLYNKSMCIPTETQFNELINNCSWKKIMQNNISIWEITGPNGNSILLPINGCKSQSSNVSYTDYGYYWTANYYSQDQLKAITFRITDTTGFFAMYKRTGAGIRAVSI